MEFDFVGGGQGVEKIRLASRSSGKKCMNQNSIFGDGIYSDERDEFLRWTAGKPV